MNTIYVFLCFDWSMNSAMGRAKKTQTQLKRVFSTQANAH